MHGSEVWGFRNFDVFEREKIEILLKKSAPTYMVYGETRDRPLSVDIKSRSINKLDTDHRKGIL